MQQRGGNAAEQRQREAVADRLRHAGLELGQQVVTEIDKPAAAERQPVRIGHRLRQRQRAHVVEEQRALAFAIDAGLLRQGHQDVPATITRRLHQVGKTGAIMGMQRQQIGGKTQQFTVHGSRA
ncbi:hypothetical protein D3C85_1475270 [compost metagenome]